jgi:hypothetical protein
MFQTYYPNHFSTALHCRPLSETQSIAVFITCIHAAVLIGTAVQLLHCLAACLPAVSYLQWPWCFLELRALDVSNLLPQPL